MTNQSFSLAVSSILRFVVQPSALAAAVLFFSSTLAFGQDGYFSNWFKRVYKTQSEQPHWIRTVVTTMRNAYLFIAVVGYWLWPSLTFAHEGLLPTGSTWSRKRKPNSRPGSLHSIRQLIGSNRIFGRTSNGRLTIAPSAH